MPIMHPFRTHEGPGARAGVVVHVGAEDEASCGGMGSCTSGDISGVGLLNVDGRWGHMLTDHVGVMGGAYFPGFRNSKSGSGYAALVGYGVLTVQGDVVSVGVGPEVGTHVAGASGGVDFELVPLLGIDWPQHVLAVSGYGRYLRPHSLEETAINAQVSSWDVGGGFRVGPVVAQYSYYQQESGVIEYVIYESSIQARSWHMFTLAVEVNADTLDFKSPSDREKDRLREERRRQRTREMQRQGAWERLHPTPVREAWPGCEALCIAQAALWCGAEKQDCMRRCKQQEVPPDCWEADDAVMMCQAQGVRCEHGRLWLPICAREQRAFEQCVREGRKR